MAQQHLQTVVTISGKVDNSFGRLGDTLVGLGSQIDMISQKLIDFGKESIEEHASYDDLMREVKALGEYSDAQIREFDNWNRQIALNSRHSMQATAAAEGLIAQLGLGIEETKALLPSVLDLSVAAKTDAATALDYLYYSLNAFGMGLDDAGVLSDQMAKTAAIGATEIDTLGRSFQRMGSTMQFFTGGSSEVLAILNGIGTFGEDMQGTKGATQLRNFMLNLIAPIGSKADLLDTLELIDMSIEEYEDMLSEEQIDPNKAVKALQTIGFTAYDASGRLKPAIQIIDELSRALDGLGEEERNTFLREIFGLRTSTMAKNILSISPSDYRKWQNEILYDSQGFTRQMADTMDGGLGGALRKLEASWSAMKETVGNSLAPAVEKVAGFLGDIAETVVNMDEDKLNALVSGLGTIAVAGPGLMAAGLAFRFIGYALTPIGAAGLGLTAVVATVNAMKDLRAADMAGEFGSMALEAEELSAYVRDLGADFEATYGAVYAYNKALGQSVEGYKQASETFSGKLMTKMLTGNELTKEDKETLRGLGRDMYTHVMEGVQKATESSMEYWTMLLGGEDADQYGDSLWSVIDVTNKSYEHIIAGVEVTAKALGKAMDDAFEDNIITGDEFSVMMKKLEEYEKAMALAMDREDYIAQQEMLQKVRTASFSEVERLSGEVVAQRDERIAKAEEEHFKKITGAEWDYDYWIAEAETAEEKERLEQERARFLADAEASKDDKLRKYAVEFDNMLLLLWEKSIEGSGLAQAYEQLGQMTGQVLAGYMTAETAQEEYRALYGASKYAGDLTLDFLAPSTSDREKVGKYLARTLGAMGGYTGLKERLAYYKQAAADAVKAGDEGAIAYNEGMVRQLIELYAMQNIATSGAYFLPIDNFITGDPISLTGEIDKAGIDLGEYIAAYTTETARQAIAGMDDGGALSAVWQEIGRAIGEQNAGIADDAIRTLDEQGQREFNYIVDMLLGTYDLDAVLKGKTDPLADRNHWFSELYAAWELLYGDAARDAEAFRLPAGVELTPDGKEAATGFQKDAQAYLDANPGNWTVNVKPVDPTKTPLLPQLQKIPLFADGGRADSPSIFGEDGPEWAIPEEHSQRTASLLDDARMASGFTWGELIARTGGLNAGSGNTIHVVYSPVIHAADARGVEQKLREDKERFNAWFREKQLLNEIEEYR